ncbi:hypothetical protein BDN71DRAFT_1433702 [Pleurotus eryngii]|uniref:Uncharacterized protein n=1 Tax=Pleurotus eryngii TaxID=5323 RepID=A0A9P5ZPE1_PLEER|nr:hypothetical protein BDN71DRAFT_1433702 [Pleurotus eryngii]
MAKGNHVAPFHKLLSSPSTDVYHLYNPKAKTVDVVHGDSICAFVDTHYNISHNQITTSSELPSGYEDFACVYNLKPDVIGKFSMIDFTMSVIHIEHTRPSLKKIGLGGNSHPTLHSTKTNAGGKVTTEKRKACVAPTDGAKGKKSAKEKKKAVAQTGMNTPLASPSSITTTLFPTMTPISPNLISFVANMMNSSGNSGQLLNAMASPSAITLPGDINMVDAPEEWELDMYLGTVVDSPPQFGPLTILGITILKKLSNTDKTNILMSSHIPVLSHHDLQSHKPHVKDTQNLSQPQLLWTLQLLELIWSLLRVQSGVQDKIPDDNDNESSLWTMCIISPAVFIPEPGAGTTTATVMTTKGKNVDPSNWGNIDFEEKDLDLEAQATAFKLWKLVKEKTQFLRKLGLGCPVPEPI